MSNQVTPETKKVSTVLEKSARALNAAELSIGKVVTDLTNNVSSLVVQQQSLAQDIEFKGRELQEITAQTDAAARDARIELDFRIRENEDQVRAQLLKKAGLVSTTTEFLTALTNEKDAAIDALNNAEYAAVSAAEKALHSSYSSKIFAIEAGHKVAIAELNANSKADQQQIKTLADQVDQLRADLKAEREARVAMAEAAAKAQGVVVNTGK